jgi:23S rRNA (guanosine2251-2'-O)-methyltransferase
VIVIVAGITTHGMVYPTILVLLLFISIVLAFQTAQAPSKKFSFSTTTCIFAQEGATEAEDNSRNSNSNIIEYVSRSTATLDASSPFHAGSEERRSRLHEALQDIGLDPSAEWLESTEFRGTAALRTYSSFVIPKSEGALAMTNQPQRAAVAANNIAFLIREHKSHQQEWLRNHDRSLAESEEIWSTSTKTCRNPVTLVLDDIRSAHNVGNIIRAAEAGRCVQILLCGPMTPSPPHPKVLKTALGAAEYVPYQKKGSTLDAVRELKREGVQVYGVETTSRSIPLWDVSFFSSTTKLPQQEIAFVFGNELVGVDVSVLEECDGLVSVPTYGIKNSLNVATCASVVLWEALRQWEAVNQHEL